MLDHEIYDIIIAHLKEILEEKVVGKIFVVKGFSDIYVWIQHPRFGSFIYTIYDVDEIDCNELTSEKLAEMVMNWHKACVLKKIFL